MTAARSPLPVRSIDLNRPWAWLRLGWNDLVRAPVASLAHGAAVTLAGWTIALLGMHAWWLAPGAVSGFVIVAPILCTGLYELSRLLSRGERPGLPAAMHAWQRGAGPLIRLGVLLMAMGTGWVLVSSLLLRTFVPVALSTPVDFLHYVARGQGDLMLTLWLLIGGLGAALVFGITAVSAPLLLGRRIGLMRALLTSVRAVGDNPLPMALWAALIMAATIASLATAMVGFIVAVPLIGHATWHAYRDLVVTDDVPLRHE